MFEGRKIKKTIVQIGRASDEVSRAALIAQLLSYGTTAFSYLIQAITQKDLSSSLGKILLTKLYVPACLDDLIFLLGDPSDVVRSVGKEVILKTIKGEAVGKLIESLQDANMHMRLSARTLLCELKSQAGVIPLLSLYNRGNREQKRNIITILVETEGPTVNKFLVSCLKDSDWSIRLLAVRGLGKTKKSENIEPLLEMLSDKDIQIKKCTVDALACMNDPRAAKSMLSLLRDDDLILRQKAMECICMIGDASIISDIIALLRESDVNTRRCGIEILNSLKDPRTADELIKAMKDSDWWVREIATDALVELKGDNIVNAMLKMLSDDDENIKRCAVEFFNRVTVKEAVDQLIASLSDEDWWVREKAATALGKLKDPKAIVPLAALRNDEEVKGVVPRALARIGSEDAAPMIIDFLQDSEKNVRKESLQALKHFKGEDIISAVKSCLNDGEEEIRLEAVKTLKAITGKVFKPGKPGKKIEVQRTTVGSGAECPEGTLLSEAILVVDICNSTAVTDKYGNEFALNVSKVLLKKVQSIAKKEECSFMKGTGDGFLITFSQVRNAISFSVTLLKEMERYNGTVDESKRIDLRFAVNFGETRVAADCDRLGHATNMTFRVEGLGPAAMIEIEGGITKDQIPNKNCIYITENILDDVKKFKEVTVKLLGLFEFKGIAGLHRIFQLLPG